MTTENVKGTLYGSYAPIVIATGVSISVDTDAS
jgi:hypothetical protein